MDFVLHSSKTLIVVSVVKSDGGKHTKQIASRIDGCGI
jgi:hypothetical protein